MAAYAVHAGGTVPARASQIDIPLADVNAGVCCFGNQANYWAQLFTAIAPTPVSLTFYVLPNSPTLDFYLLVTSISSSQTSFGPASVLFESPLITAANFYPSTDSLGYKTTNVSLAGLVLAPGEQYFWILDPFVINNGIANNGQMLAVFRDQIIYPQGELFAFPPTGLGLAADLNQNLATRGTALNLAFTMDFASAVPEPSTWAMMIVGFACIGFAACRRKAKRNCLQHDH